MFYAEPRDPVSKGDSERAVRCVPPGSADDPGRQGTEEGDRRQEEPRAQRSRLCRKHESGGSQGPLRPALQSGTFSITVLIFTSERRQAERVNGWYLASSSFRENLAPRSIWRS